MIIEELRSIQTMSSLRPADRYIIFLGAICSERLVKDEELLRLKPVLAAMTSTSIQQRHLLAAAEWLCGTRFPSLLKFFPVVLKQFYELDLIEEDTLYEWDTDFLRNDFTADASMISDETLEALKTHAKQFVVWLREAEEEGDEDDGEEAEDGDEDEES